MSAPEGSHAGTIGFPSCDLNSAAAYQLMASVIVPRPIALVATRDAAGNANLAPFSFFNGVSHTPPTLAFAIGPRDDGVKDTARNLEAHPEFIVHIVNEAMLRGVDAASEDFSSSVDEFLIAEFERVPGTVVDVPRVKRAPVALECKVLKTVVLGPNDKTTRLILGEILFWNLDRAVYTESFRIDSGVLGAIGRMGAGEYCRTSDRLRGPSRA